MLAELKLGDHADEMDTGLLRIRVEGLVYQISIGKGDLHFIDARQLQEIITHLQHFLDATKIDIV